MKTHFILAVVLVFIITFLITHKKVLCMTSLLPFQNIQPAICLTPLYVHRTLLQNKKINTEEILTRP